ncbi:MAG: outer membrane lipoprotein chaperone LolA [Gammaproteobacteria bacterium]|nr:outer membrane lipoprotein chaperone LolA [Gammaproteobacteria bacterium]
MVMQSVTAADLPAERAAAELRSRLSSLNTFVAAFEQQVENADGRIIDEGSGRFWLSRPGRFRWEYATPWPRLLMADGSSLWLFDEELEQVTVRDAGGLLDDTPAAILAGRLELLERYRISGTETDGVLQVRLEPMEAATDFRRIDLQFAGSELLQLVLLDQFGQVTRIGFTDSASNTELDPALFEFVVPDGADVIDERGG